MRRIPLRKTKRLGLLLVSAALLAAALPVAADELSTGREIYEEELRVQLDQQKPVTQDVGFDGGGWFVFGLFNYDDAVGQRHRTLRQFQLRGWAALNIEGVHKAYIRGLLNWDDWNAGDNPYSFRGDDFHERIERAWYQFDHGQMLRNQTGEQPAVDFRFKIGRDYTRIGSAFVLSLPMDLIQFDVATGDWAFKALLGKPVEQTRNIDESPLVATHQDRCFFAVETRYFGFERHQPYAYYLGNWDHTSPERPDFGQDYDYTSHYIGLGMEGNVLHPNVRYLIELVGEMGKTYSRNTVTDREDICAMAIDAQLEYVDKGPMKPRFGVEYMWGSGDDDRQTSSSATVGGNRRGTTDHAFNSFGFRDTGVAFAPRVSNLHIYAMGASCFPLETMEWFRKMEVGTKVFFYHKSRSSGAISDTTATDSARWVGWEWDVFCDWRITSDLAWTMRYGFFDPGNAFDRSDDTCRQFLYTGLVWSF